MRDTWVSIRGCNALRCSCCSTCRSISRTLFKCLDDGDGRRNVRIFFYSKASLKHKIFKWWKGYLLLFSLGNKSKLTIIRIGLYVYLTFALFSAREFVPLTKLNVRVRENNLVCSFHRQLWRNVARRKENIVISNWSLRMKGVEIPCIKPHTWLKSESK